jgi:hypothetical protein
MLLAAKGGVAGIPPFIYPTQNGTGQGLRLSANMSDQAQSLQQQYMHMSHAHQQQQLPPSSQGGNGSSHHSQSNSVPAILQKP